MTETASIPSAFRSQVCKLSLPSPELYSKATGQFARIDVKPLNMTTRSRPPCWRSLHQSKCILGPLLGALHLHGSPAPPSPTSWEMCCCTSITAGGGCWPARHFRRQSSCCCGWAPRKSLRWLANRGREEDANAVLFKVFGPGVSAADLPEEVTENLRVGALIKFGYGKRMAPSSASSGRVPSFRCSPSTRSARNPAPTVTGLDDLPTNSILKLRG